MTDTNVFKYLEVVPDIPKSDWGKTFVVKCPCGGKLIVGRAIGNGHLRLRCDSCRFRLIEWENTWKSEDVLFVESFWKLIGEWFVGIVFANINREDNRNNFLEWK